MIQLTPVAMADDAMKDLYNEAFPLEERRPWPLQEQLIAAGRLRITRMQIPGSAGGITDAASRSSWALRKLTVPDRLSSQPASTQVRAISGPEEKQ